MLKLDLFQMLVHVNKRQIDYHLDWIYSRIFQRMFEFSSNALILMNFCFLLDKQNVIIFLPFDFPHLKIVAMSFYQILIILI
jgi:hypothetical protein